jgi:hypothetical protein
MASLCRLFNLIGSRQPAVALAPVAVGRGELLEFLICDEVLRQLAPPTLIGVYSTSHSVVFFFSHNKLAKNTFCHGLLIKQTKRVQDVFECLILGPCSALFHLGPKSKNFLKFLILSNLATHV